MWDLFVITAAAAAAAAAATEPPQQRQRQQYWQPIFEFFHNLTFAAQYLLRGQT